MATVKDLNKFRENFLKQKLRRISYQWPPRKEALKNARVSRGKYECSICKEDEKTNKYYGPKEIVLDHIIPVIDTLEGFADWNTYIARLFCGLEGWQVLCHDHHNIKTQCENEVRKDNYLKKPVKKLKKKAKKRKKKKR